MTARGSGLRIWWDCHRGCCEAGPPPSMPRCRVSIHENLERILWLRKRRRRKRRRRRRPRKRRRSKFWPGWSSFSSARAPNSGCNFGERRAFGPPFSFSALCCRRPCERRDPYAAAHRLNDRVSCLRTTNCCGYGSLRSQGRRAERTALRVHSTHYEAVSAPQTRAWRRARRSRRQNSGAARPSPSAG